MKKFTIRLSFFVKLLNVILNFKLNWKIYIQHIEKKIIFKLMNLKNCAKFIWKISYENLKKFYQKMIFFIFCLYIRFDTFFTFRITKFKTNTLTKVYKKFKNVSKISLNVECHMLFIRQIFEKIIFDATFKIQIYFNYELIKIIRQSINQQKFRKKMRKL